MTKRGMNHGTNHHEPDGIPGGGILDKMRDNLHSKVLLDLVQRPLYLKILLELACSAADPAGMSDVSCVINTASGRPVVAITAVSGGEFLYVGNTRRLTDESQIRSRVKYLQGAYHHTKRICFVARDNGEAREFRTVIARARGIEPGKIEWPDQEEDVCFSTMMWDRLFSAWNAVPPEDSSLPLEVRAIWQVVLPGDKRCGPRVDIFAEGNEWYIVEGA